MRAGLLQPSILVSASWEKVDVDLPQGGLLKQVITLPNLGVKLYLLKPIDTIVCKEIVGMQSLD